MATARPPPLGVVAGRAVLHAGLAGVRRAVVDDLGAVAAASGGDGDARYGRFGLHHELRQRLQTPTSLVEMLSGVL